METDEQTIVKVAWDQGDDDLWQATLLLTGPGGFGRRQLPPDRDLELEITSERRCTGYAPAQGEREPCPEYREIASGSQCAACRNRGIYSDYVTGNSAADVDGEFLVYLAQAGTAVKVGVTRDGNEQRRWIEQGADFGMVLERGLTGDEALGLEDRLSHASVSQTIRKERKTEPAQDERLDSMAADLGYAGAVTDLRERMVYPPMRCGRFGRTGILRGPVQSVKGQIIGVKRQCIAMTSGRVVRTPDQSSLERF